MTKQRITLNDSAATARIIEKHYDNEKYSSLVLHTASAYYSNTPGNFWIQDFMIGLDYRNREYIHFYRVYSYRANIALLDLDGKMFSVNPDYIKYSSSTTRHISTTRLIAHYLSLKEVPWTSTSA